MRCLAIYQFVLPSYYRFCSLTFKMNIKANNYLTEFISNFPVFVFQLCFHQCPLHKQKLFYQRLQLLFQLLL